MRSNARKWWARALAVVFVAAGANHFINPSPYLSMMPPYLPWPATLVSMSGVAEVLGGIVLLFPMFRAAAGWGLIVLLIAVFPANLHVALYGWPGVDLPRWSLWLRLPLQVVFIWWIYRVCIQTVGSPEKNPP